LEIATWEEKLESGESSEIRKAERLGQPYVTEIEGEEEITALPGWTRTDRIAAILLRPQTLELIEALERQNSSGMDAAVILGFLLDSQANLHTFADLVSEDLVSISNRRLVLTPLAERLIEQVARLE
jgi:hypothetical protein